MATQTCPPCRGSGKTSDGQYDCGNCGGSGYVYAPDQPPTPPEPKPEPPKK